MGKPVDPAHAGAWLKGERERRKISVRKLATSIDVATQMIYSWEAGKNAVSDERAEQIAEVFGMDLVEVRRNLGLWVPPESDEQPKREPRVGDDFEERIARILAASPAARRRAAEALRIARIPEVEEEEDRRGHTG